MFQVLNEILNDVAATATALIKDGSCCFTMSLRTWNIYLNPYYLREVILIFTIKSELLKVFEVQIALNLCRNELRWLKCCLWPSFCSKFIHLALNCSYVCFLTLLVTFFCPYDFRSIKAPESTHRLSLATLETDKWP